MKENNKLIAEFMEIESYVEPLTNYTFYKLPEKFHTIYGDGNAAPYSEVLADKLAFHTSWAWLMPVVESCSSLVSYDNDMYSYVINAGFNGIVYYDGDLYAGYSVSEACDNIVSIIKWYNENKKEIRNEV